MAELESHLRDEYDRQKRAGENDENAFAAVVSAVGKPDAVGYRYDQR